MVWFDFVSLVIFQSDKKRGAKISLLLCNMYRNLLGEDLGPLSVKELDQLERQLESSLKLIRSTKVLKKLASSIASSLCTW